MGILGNIMSAIFGGGSAAAAPAAAPAAKTPAAGGAAPAAAGAAPAAGGASASAQAPAASAMSAVDVAAVLDGLAKQNKEKLDWRRSIVDLMKLLGLDSSLAARKELAQELHYSGDTGDSAKMNVWLHKQVMTKLAENGGKVPDDLK